MRNLLARMARLTAPGGKVHVLDLVLPPHASAGRVLARLDRGRFARPIDHGGRCSASTCAKSTSALRVRTAVAAALEDGLLRGSTQVSSRRVTIAIPIHNEEAVLPELLRRVLAVLDQTPGGPHELLLVDDGSRDGSLRILEEAAATRSAHRVIVLSRNFGHQAAVSAAFDHATGDVMMVMDGDLQDAPEALPILLERLDQGFDVVYVRRTQRKESFWLRTSYHVAYRIISKSVEAGAAGGRGRLCAAVAPRRRRRPRVARAATLSAGPAKLGRVPADRRGARAACPRRRREQVFRQRADRPGARWHVRVLDGAAAIHRICSADGV